MKIFIYNKVIGSCHEKKKDFCIKNGECVLNVECIKLTLIHSYAVASRETLSVHVREIDTVVQESAVSSLTLEIAKTPRHHFNLFTSARRSLTSLLLPFSISFSFRAGTRAPHPCCSCLAVSENVKYRPAQLASNN